MMRSDFTDNELYSEPPAANPLDAMRASRQHDRTLIADALTETAIKHGAAVERQHSKATPGYCGQGIDLHFSCKGVGAMVNINDLHGGEWVLIHWFNAACPARNFTHAFQAAVKDGSNGRPHHKATSHPRDWHSLANMLDGGLQLAARGEAFEPAKAEGSAT